MPKKDDKPLYAPGIDDADIIPRADDEDKKKGNVTRETRVFLDENDPGGEKS